jgi:hypothetical protein
MHYYETMHLRLNKFVIVVYIHEVLGKPGKTDPMITSIQDCNYFPVYMTKKILDKPKKVYKQMRNFNKEVEIKTETYYRVEFKASLKGKKPQYKIMKVTDVSNNKNPMLQLH